MCIIVYKPFYADVTRKTLSNCWANNSDGGGYMYASNGVLHINKGFMSFKKMWKSFRGDWQNNPDSDFVLHFRIGTSGLNSPSMTHPFPISSKLGLVHNGILSGLGSKKESDTYQLVNNILKFLPGPSKIELLTTLALESSSKFILMNNLGEGIIFNEKKGEYDVNGVWYSNTGYKHSWHEEYSLVSMELDEEIEILRKLYTKEERKFLTTSGAYDHYLKGEEEW